MKKIFTIVAMAIMAIALNAQNVTRTMEFEGTTRKYVEHIPASPNGSMPVLFQLHGLGDNCNNFSQLGFESLAPNWIIITPEATEASIMGQPAGTAWAAGVGGENIPYINSIELNAGVNDEGFILAILDSLENNFDIDTDSIFITGFSMGGFMSNKMAVKHADRITAIASVSGTLGHFQAFEPTGKINTMHIHGTSDETISYADASFSYSGFSIQVGLGAEALVETWRNYNECGTEPTVYNFEDTKNDGLTFEQYTYKNNETGNKTVFIKVNNGVHTWYDAAHNDIDYTTEIYKFFIGEENEPTKVEENISDAIAIYPNPATDIVNIVSQNDSELAIYNATGKEIKRVSTTQNNTAIDISDLPNGMYFVVVDGHAQKLTIAR
ncbi:MAG: T9SS type A sorting domain-containing protein [Bacteroidales bacterium]|nr:T9SS type A sorting domain-containing protein [Bacteroidales bacterium]